MEAKIMKLSEQFASTSHMYKESNLFEGISIYVNGRTNPSADELKRIMMIHGGTYHHYQRSHTTYIVASNLPDVKVNQINRNTTHIIRPEWIVDCVKEKRILDYSNYLLYTNYKSTQPRLNFSKNNPVGLNCKKILQPDKTLHISSTEGHLEPFASKTIETRPIDQQDIVNDSFPAVNINQCQMDNESNNVQDVIDQQSVADVQEDIQDASLRSSSNIARTAVDPRFLNEFYSNSRLHHIATLGAELKNYINDLRVRQQGNAQQFPLRNNLKEKLQGSSANSDELAIRVTNIPKQSSCIMHIDMDCFFVSVGLRKVPHLKGTPVAVTHSKG